MPNCITFAHIYYFFFEETDCIWKKMLIFAPKILKQEAYELDNINEHSAELSALDVTLDEQ